MFDISVVIASYNPDYDKLFFTLKSIIVQRGINFEIVVSDDGSQNNYFEDIEKWFKNNTFCDYVLVRHENNMGTCINIYDGVKESNGRYVKTISPGDYLYDETTLLEWYQFMEEKHSKISFGKVLNFHIDTYEGVVLDRVMQRPQVLKPYSSGNLRKIKNSYLLLNDIPDGAAFIAQKSVLLKYYKMIVNKVKYAEDYAMKLMVLDDIKIDYYDRYVVWYEFGTGISTSKNEVWAKRLKQDYDEINLIIRKKGKCDVYSRKYIKLLLIQHNNKLFGKIVKYLLFPDVIKTLIIKKMIKKYTPIECDITELKKILSSYTI